MADITSTGSPTTPIPPSGLGEPVVLQGTVGAVDAPLATKAGWRTTEFWLKVAADIITLLYASGVLPSTGLIATVVAIIAMQLTSAGYMVVRTSAKKSLVAAQTALMMVVAGVVIAACAAGSTARRDTSIGVVSTASCEVAGLSTEDAADAWNWAKAKVDSWISGVTPGDYEAAKAKILADLKQLKGQLFPCMIAGVIAALTGPPNPSDGTRVASQAITGLTPDARATVVVAFRLAARDAGWPLLSTPGGAQ